MKKFTLLFAALFASVLTMMSQTDGESVVIDSIAAVDGSNYVLVADPATLVSPATADEAEPATVNDEPAAVVNDEPAAVEDDSAAVVAEPTDDADQAAVAEEPEAVVADSTQLADEEEQPVVDEFSEGDEIELKYVPNRFTDNWEINLAGGVSLLLNGIGHNELTTDKAIISGSRGVFDALGGVAEITATKWFNPYAALRVGWLTGYMPCQQLQKGDIAMDNYIHVDALWDWTTQFGGYKPNRIYDAVPYIHAGVVVTPAYNAGIGGGLGFLSRFHVAEHWVINLDLRSTMTTARKYGLESGIAINMHALVGVTYRFNKVGWKKTVENPYKETLIELRAANEELDQKRARAEEENEKLEETAVQREQERKDLAKLVNAITKDTTFYGVPDTMEMTVYYSINSSELSMHEKAHMDIYMRLIGLNDPNYMHVYKVIGTADGGTGDRSFNERLCQRRAEAIKAVLIENGVDPENITTEIEIIDSGDAQLARASRVIIYPVEKPKIIIPDSINLDVDDEE